MSPIQTIPVPGSRQGFSLTDLLTIGLMLMILMAVSLPLFHSAGNSAGKRISNPTAAVHTAALIDSLR